MGLISWLFSSADQKSIDEAYRVLEHSRSVREEIEDHVKSSRKTIVEILPIGKAIYEHRGWKLVNNVLKGYYRTKYGSFKGYIKNPFSDNPEFFIVNPPQAIQEGNHSACFHERIKNTYYIHLNGMAEYKDINSGILCVEFMLLEALND